MDRGIILDAGPVHVFDEASGILYSLGDGEITRWNARTGEQLSAIPLPGTASSMAISPDGLHLLIGSPDVAEDGGQRSAILYRVDVAAESVDTLAFGLSDTYEGWVANVAISATGQAFFTTHFLGSGWTPFRTFDLAADTPEATTVGGLTLMSGYVRGSTHLITSPDGNHVLVLETNASNGPLSLIRASSGEVEVSSDLYAIGRSGFNDGRADVTNEGLSAVLTYNSFVIYDQNLNVLEDFSAMQFAGNFLDVQFSQDGRQLYVWDHEQDLIRVYDTTDWVEIGELDPGFAADHQGNGSYYGRLELIDDGQLLVATTPDGLRIIDVGARLTTEMNGTSGNDTLLGTIGMDTLSGGLGDDVLDGGSGVDTVSYAGASARVVIDLQLTGPQNTVSDGWDALSHFENMEGSAFNDTLRADDVANTIHGGAGADLLDGRGGNDIIYGGTENDRLYGRAGDDKLYGEEGHDLIHANEGADLIDGGAGNDRLYGWEGNDTFHGGDGGDRIYGGDGADIGHGGLMGDFLNGHGGNDRLYGDEGDDGLYGSDGNDILYGGAGNDILKGDDLAVGHDRLYGGDGADRLYGEGGDDVIDGGAGNDFIYGGAGIDTLTGGAGADRFIFIASVELGGPSLLATITDFDDTQDFIDLRSIDADPNTAGNQAFTWASGGFTGQAGEAFLSYDAGTGFTTLALDIDGDGVADYEIRLEGEIDQSDHFLI